MPTRALPQAPTEAAISVTAMAARCGLSRTRFYELIQAGLMPQPCYCVHTRRPMYPRELIDQCLHVRTTNIGANGRYILFYERRALRPVATAPTPRRRRSCSPPEGRVAALREGLASLGMTAVADTQITTALISAFPAGTAGLDDGTVLAAVFRLLRSPDTAPMTPGS